MSAVVPYGASGAWHLDNDIAEIAAHYRLRFRTLKRSDARAGGMIAHARDALAWKLVKQRQFSNQRAADLLKLEEKTVREAVSRHVNRVREFQGRFKPIEQVSE